MIRFYNHRDDSEPTEEFDVDGWENARALSRAITNFLACRPDGKIEFDNTDFFDHKTYVVKGE